MDCRCGTIKWIVDGEPLNGCRRRTIKWIVDEEPLNGL